MVLAATYRNQGFSSDHALALLEATAQKQSARTGEAPYSNDQLQREIITPVYSPSWKGGIYAKDEAILQLTRTRFNLMESESNIDLVDIKDVGIEFQDFAKNIDKNTIKTGLKSLDDNVLITSGMMVALLAAPGAGKTSFANLFVENLSLTGENAIFFSLDMYKNLLFSRLLQKYSGYDMRKILHMYKNNNPDKILVDAYADVLKNYTNAHFNFRSGPTVEEIEQEIITYQQDKGKNVKLVVVDYLEKVRGPFSDATANSAYVASRLSDIAKKYHTTVLLLVQPQKSAGDPREELVSYRKIKGASVIEQDSRVILTMSRPGYDPKDMSNDTFASISVVKNNMGSLCQLDFAWEGVTGKLSELNTNQRAELKALRKELAESKAATEKAWDI
jgi:replicative DNA helicase